MKKSRKINNLQRWHGEKAMKAYDNMKYEKNHNRLKEYERLYARHISIFDALGR